MSTQETRTGSESMIARILRRLGQFGLLLGILLIFGSPAFVAAGVGRTAYLGLGIAAVGLGGYLLGRLVARSSVPDDEAATAAPTADE